MIPGAPAERWGLEVGDVVAKVDGQTVRTRGELYDRIWSHAPGDVVQLEVLRGDRALMLSVRSADAEDFFD
jgi:S1-C subfamily serine protease